MIKIRFLTIVALVILTSCEPLLNIKSFPSTTEYLGVDFSKYSEEGFFITTEGPNGKYTPIGLFTVKMNQGAELFENRLGTNEAGQAIVNRYWEKDSIHIQMAVDSLVSMAKRYGADAIVNFDNQIELSQRPISAYETIDLASVYVSGFAIKREYD